MVIRLLLSLVVVALVSCTAPLASTPSPTTTTSSGAQIGGALRVALASDVATLDPWNASDTSSLLVTRQLFETLVEYEPGGFRIVPRLAESWQVSPDGRTWTFSLRRGLKFHDGTDFDAVAVATNLDRARLSAHPLRGGGGPGGFASYAALLEGFDDASVIANVEVRDAATVAITTKAPFGPLLTDLALPAFAIVSPKSMRDDPTGWSTPASGGAAGTGPFLFRPGAWQRDDGITLERSAGYAQRDRDGLALPYLDRLAFRTITDEATRIAELRAGTIDVTYDLTLAAIPAVRADPKLQLIPRRAASVSYLGVAATAAPFDRPEVRRAVAMTIDKTVIATTIYSGTARAAPQLLPASMLGHDDSVVEFYRYDTAAAKGLLGDAGLPSGFATELHYPPAWRAYQPDPRRVAESVAADLARIGISVSVRAGDPLTYRADAGAGRFPLWLGDTVFQSGDPDALFPDGAPWSGEVAAELLRRARAEPDASKRTELYKQVSKIIQQDASRVPLVYSDPLAAATGKLRGLVPHPLGVDAYAAVWLGR